MAQSGCASQPEFPSFPPGLNLHLSEVQLPHAQKEIGKTFL